METCNYAKARPPGNEFSRFDRISTRVKLAGLSKITPHTLWLQDAYMDV